MEKRKVGRPKKNNAVKPGQLKKGERRYTFITTGKFVDDIKKGAKEEDLNIKDYLEKILRYYWDSNKPKNKNEEQLKKYLNNQENMAKKN